MRTNVVPFTSTALAEQQQPSPGEALLQRYQSALTGVFGTPQAVLVRGSGARVWDAEGNEYLDLLGGIAVNALGHAHPLISSVISSQQATLGHISNLFTSPTQIALAEKLLALASAPEGSSVFFANSGSEANEAALKAVLRHRAQTGRQRILALEGSFHGRTIGALSLTHKPAYREPFGELVPGVEFLPVNDLAALESAFEHDDVAGIFLEPIQGEAGVLPLEDAYLLRARELTRTHSALLVLDEVQTGIGRTGEWFRYQAVDGVRASHPPSSTASEDSRESGLHSAQPGVVGHEVTRTDSGESARVPEVAVPDLMTLAKGLGSGFPIGALVSFGQQASTLMGAGQHGTTFGGNPPATAAALATLHAIETGGVLENVNAVGAQLASALRALPQVDQVRQFGLHIGVDLDVPGVQAPAKELVTIARERHGLIVNATGECTLRLAPPLNLTAEEAAEAVNRLTAALIDLSGEAPA
ncbi:aminotransferase class III-fold pyridoxal phosphate-dependent enzyme [Nesterenkonia ebinurensis]|uniref:aminotransferase class III-fold pyridoxal phosphate-dependent enzyme n=1 Tax=Nesterenkonia ebinurensis TaxID=2608252 RepID=UPI00123D8401|nr:aminotransferase class III-fold pyridoxal phosphate-dependent enzyme [Nesterenkonia ebinurensis]